MPIINVLILILLALAALAAGVLGWMISKKKGTAGLGLKTSNGLGMLVWQGVYALEHFTQAGLDKAAMAGCVLRTRRAGDRLVPLGMAGSRLLSDIFTDRKLPRPLRDRWPVAAKGNEILWIPGVGISEKAKIGTGERTEIICRPEAWLSEWLKIRKDEEHAYGCRVYPAGSEDD